MRPPENVVAGLHLLKTLIDPRRDYDPEWSAGDDLAANAALDWIQLLADDGPELPFAKPPRKRRKGAKS